MKKYIILFVLSLASTLSTWADNLVAAGGEHYLAVKSDGTLWAWGSNSYGQIGDGKLETAKCLKPVKVTSNVVSVAAGLYHSLAIKNDGSLWAWGQNNNGQLGDGTLDNRNKPVKIMDGVKQVAAGDYHTVVLKTDGSVWTWGYNSKGQIGDDTYVTKNSPVKIMDGVKQIGAGCNYTFAIENNGTLWGWGQNTEGQFGDGTRLNRRAPRQIRDGVKTVAGGEYHTLFQMNDESIYASGRNTSGQLGDGSKAQTLTAKKIMNGAKMIATGRAHSLAIDNSSVLYAWGLNDEGQIGDGSKSDKTEPTRIMTSVKQMAASDYNTIAMKNDGTVWVWGWNRSGQLGDGTTASSTKPIEVTLSDGQVTPDPPAATNYYIVGGPNGDWVGTAASKELKFKHIGKDVTEDPVYSISFDAPEGDCWFAIGDDEACDAITNNGDWTKLYGTTKGNGNNGLSGKLTRRTNLSDDGSFLVPAGSKSIKVTIDMKEMTYLIELTSFGKVETTVAGIDYLVDFDTKTATVTQARGTMTNRVIPESIIYKGQTFTVTGIADYAFKDSSSFDYSITVPSTVTEVSAHAFDGICAPALIWKSNTKLPENAFDNIAWESMPQANFLLYVNNRSIAPSKMKNVVANGKAESIILTEGSVFHCPQTFTATSISYTHRFSMETAIGYAGGWETIALPFDVQQVTHESKGQLVPFAAYTKGSGNKPFWLYELGSAGFVQTSTIKANTPYLISMPNNSAYSSSFCVNGKVTFSATNTTVAAIPLKGNEPDYKRVTYQGKEFTLMYLFNSRERNVHAINSVTDLWSLTDARTAGSVFISNLRIIYPFEAYFYYNDPTGARSVIDIPFADNTSTGIDTPFRSSFRSAEGRLQGKNVQRSTFNVYSLSGQLVYSGSADDLNALKQQLPAGVYLVNGKKIVIP